MPDYVYALHDFLPEHEDEVTFHAGERIEVVEKDDLYNDGWWQGRNLAGRVGLFPVSYTTPAPPGGLAPAIGASVAPSTSTHSTDTTATNKYTQPPREEPGYTSPTGPNIVSPVPKPPPVSFLDHGDDYDVASLRDDSSSLHLASDPNGEVMKATMTDVQKAIEQLGRGGAGGDGDGARSFSFASTRDGRDTETDTDFDLSDVDAPPAQNEGGEDWHKSARRKLADKARRAVEEAEKLEAMMNGNGGGGSEVSRRTVAPPIEVELSDESDVEDGDYTRSRFHRDHPNIIEEEEDAEDAGPGHGRARNGLGHLSHVTEESSKELGPSDISAQGLSGLKDGEVVIPPKTELDDQTSTATKTSFSVFSPPATATPAASRSPPPITPIRALSPPPPARSRATSPVRTSYPTPTSPQLMNAVTITPIPPVLQQESRRNSTPQSGLPSPSPSSRFSATNASKHQSTMSTSSAPNMIFQAPLGQQHAPSTNGFALVPREEAKKKPHPTEWSVEDVVEWLASKNFDKDVCDKFVEQEITGDVLLELDVNLLKTEIGIMAFGKRMRIANAITELRRPPSIEYSDHHTSSEHPSPMQTHPHTHSRSQSQGQQSHHSFPGTLTTTASLPGYTYQQSVQSSPGGPLGYGSQLPPTQESYSHGVDVDATPEARRSIGNASLGNTPVAMSGVAAGMAAAAGVGLGIAMAPPPTSPGRKGRSSHLISSPSDGALKESAARSIHVTPGIMEDEERGHMSDGDVAPTTTSMRRRLFGRSHDSSTLSIVSSKHSKESPMPSPMVQTLADKEKEKDKDTVKESGVAEKEKEKKENSNRDSTSTGTGRRPKKTSDGKGSERLSIFGGSFGGSLGKSRKPPPSASEDIPTEKTSKFSLPRLHGPSIRKSSSTTQYPFTPNESPKDAFVFLNSDVPEKEREPTEKERNRESKSPSTLRKRTTSAPSTPVNGAPVQDNPNVAAGPFKQGQNFWDQIGEADHTGWMRKKGDRYNTWKQRYFVLKGPHLYCLRNNNKTESRIKGYIHITGYKVTVDENVDPGRYGFRIDHDHDKTHFFSSEEKSIIREWMKAIMKATIGRDYTKPVVSSCNIPTIPLVVAQAMNPAPRPPSPTARDATQKAMRRENPDQLSSRDARVLMGLPSGDGEGDKARVDSFFSEDAENNKAIPASTRRASAPPRPSREMRGTNSQRTSTHVGDDALIDWANSHLPEALQISGPAGPLCSGLGLLRLAESIKGKPSSPPVPDTAFPLDAADDKLDGLFRLFDFLLDNDVKMGSVSINDIRQGKRDKILQLLRALKSWEEKRRAIENTIGRTSVQAGGFMVI